MIVRKDETADTEFGRCCDNVQRPSGDILMRSHGEQKLQLVVHFRSVGGETVWLNNLEYEGSDWVVEKWDRYDADGFILMFD